MTLLMYVLSLSLTFICSTYDECVNIRNITYEYVLPAVEEELVCGYDYIIRENIYFIDVNGESTLKTVDYEVPLLSDWRENDWQNAIAYISNERGVDIVEYTENGAVGKVSEKRLEAYKDLYKDGFVSDMDSFDYLDERELKEQQTRYTVIFCSFALFYSAVSMVNTVFAYWLKPKKGV